MKILFYDTETTGLPLFKESSAHPGQPHIVQIAALLVEDTSREYIAGLNLTIRPDGWVIPPEASAVHGITMERAKEEGLPEKDVVERFLELWRESELRVGHNEGFDARILRIALKRFFTEQHCEAWEGGKAACTATLATPILAIPPTPKMVRAGFLKHKTPNLQEAFQYFFGKPFEGAHDAMTDVKACMDVYFAMKEPS